MTKQTQYNEYLSYGGTMTIEEWENDCRYNKSLEPDSGYKQLTIEVKELNIMLADERDPAKVKDILAKLANTYQLKNENSL